MELVTLVTLLTASFITAYMAFNTSQTNKPIRLFFLFLSMLFLWLAIGALYTLSLSPETRLTNTTETSRYWNCTTLNYTCTGTPDTNSCIEYTDTQCQQINADGENCTWIGTPPQDYCYGTPTWTCQQLLAWGQQHGYGNNKCTETTGCTLNTTLVKGICDEVTLEYNYQNYNRTWTYDGGTRTALSIIQYAIMFLMFYFIVFFLINFLQFIYDIATGEKKSQEYGGIN